MKNKKKSSAGSKLYKIEKGIKVPEIAVSRIAVFPSAVALTLAKLEKGDSFLIKVKSPVVNHAAINLGGERILHHVYGRLSTIDTWAGYWAKHHCLTLRHKSMIGTI